jgi:thioredoxin reductase
VSCTLIFVAGDASRDAQFVVVAAAEGVKAAMAINQALQRQELKG